MNKNPQNKKKNPILNQTLKLNQTKTKTAEENVKSCLFPFLNVRTMKLQNRCWMLMNAQVYGVCADWSTIQGRKIFKNEVSSENIRTYQWSSDEVPLNVMMWMIQPKFIQNATLRSCWCRRHEMNGNGGSDPFQRSASVCRLVVNRKDREPEEYNFQTERILAGKQTMLLKFEFRFDQRAYILKAEPWHKPEQKVKLAVCYAQPSVNTTPYGELILERIWELKWGKVTF